MASITRNRVVFGLCVSMLLVLPGMAAAQSTSTFVIPYERVGTPVIDPATGVNVGGAFINPCTFENVDITGSATVTIHQSARDAKGEFRVTAGVVSRGTGAGWTGDYANAIWSGSTYVLFENQDFKATVPVLGAGEYFESSFSDKFNLKGQGPTDNWVVRAYFKIKIDAKGNVQVWLERMNDDVCKG